MRAVKRGWTLHEMIISLAVTGGVLALVVHAALGQLRFFHGVGEIADLRGQLAQTTLVPRALLWGASSAGGDITVARDTAIELAVGIGSAVVCESAPGWIIIPTAAPAGNSLSAFAESPQQDDRIAALVEDSVGATWINFRVATAPTSGSGCPRFPAASGGLRIGLVEQISIPEGTPLRFLRPMRLSLYRASDGRWYLGARDWNAAAQRFNTIQPVAGPLDASESPGGTSGLRFQYFDSRGAEIGDGSEPRLIAGVRITAYGTSQAAVRMGGTTTTPAERIVDSSVTEIALRNAR